MRPITDLGSIHIVRKDSIESRVRLMSGPYHYSDEVKGKGSHSFSIISIQFQYVHFFGVLCTALSQRAPQSSHEKHSTGKLCTYVL